MQLENCFFFENNHHAKDSLFDLRLFWWQNLCSSIYQWLIVFGSVKIRGDCNHFNKPMKIFQCYDHFADWEWLSQWSRDVYSVQNFPIKMVQYTLCICMTKQNVFTFQIHGSIPLWFECIQWDRTFHVLLSSGKSLSVSKIVWALKWFKFIVLIQLKDREFITCTIRSSEILFNVIVNHFKAAR